MNSPLAATLTMDKREGKAQVCSESSSVVAPSHNREITQQGPVPQPQLASGEESGWALLS